MPNPWLILGVVLAFVANGFYWDNNGARRATTQWGAAAQRAVVVASENARNEERKKQGEVNEALRKQNETLGRVNAGLHRDLDGLRNRPERPADLSATPRATCQDANGAELAGEYARFLVRFAALAAEQDAALEACQNYADIVAKQTKE